jgi:hypothetical protein
MAVGTVDSSSPYPVELPQAQPAVVVPGPSVAQPAASAIAPVGPPPAQTPADTIEFAAAALGKQAADMRQQLVSGNDLSTLLGTGDPYARSAGGITGGLAVNLFA